MGTRIDRRFDYLRQRAEQGANQRSDETNQAIQRRGIQQGIAGGAQAKLVERAQRQNEELKAQELGGIESEREMALAQQDELEAGRKFAREERMGSQDFAGQQAELGRQFQASESMKAKDHEGWLLKKNQGFQSLLFNKEMKFKKSAQKAAEGQFGQQMKLAMKQFKLDKTVSQFNMDMAERMANKKDLIGGVGGWLEKARKGGGNFGSDTVLGAAAGGMMAGGSGAVTGGLANSF
jgi:hypothetical protein